MNQVVTTVFYWLHIETPHGSDNRYEPLEAVDAYWKEYEYTSCERQLLGKTVEHIVKL